MSVNTSLSRDPACSGEEFHSTTLLLATDPHTNMDTTTLRRAKQQPSRPAIKNSKGLSTSPLFFPHIASGISKSVFDSLLYDYDAPDVPSMPTLERLLSSDTSYRKAETETQISIEKSLLQEKFHACYPTAKVVHQGPITPGIWRGGKPLPREHTAVYHAVEDVVVSICVYAHLGSVRMQLMGALTREFARLDREGKLGKGRPCGMLVIGVKVEFWEYDRGVIEKMVFGGLQGGAVMLQ